MEISKEILDFIIRTAERKTSYEKWEDFNPSNDGNYDDAYYYGSKDGEIHFARGILNRIEVDYNIKE